MEIEQYLYDLNDSGEAIVAYTMRSSSGASVQLCNLGASVLSYNIADGEGGFRDIASGRCVRSLEDGGDRFDEKLWESRVEVNRVVMSLSYERGGVGVMAEVIFDFDDDDSFEITYQACLDGDAEFELTHKLSFDLGGEFVCDVRSSCDSRDYIYDIDGAREGILGEVALLSSLGSVCRVAVLSSHPQLYFDPTTSTIAPTTSPIKIVKSGTRYIQKTVFKAE